MGRFSQGNQRYIFQNFPLSCKGRLIVLYVLTKSNLKLYHLCVGLQSLPTLLKLYWSIKTHHLGTPSFLTQHGNHSLSKCLLPLINTRTNICTCVFHYTLSCLPLGSGPSGPLRDLTRSALSAQQFPRQQAQSCHVGI